MHWVLLPFFVAATVYNYSNCTAKDASLLCQSGSVCAGCCYCGSISYTNMSCWFQHWNSKLFFPLCLSSLSTFYQLLLTFYQLFINFYQLFLSTFYQLYHFLSTFYQLLSTFLYQLFINFFISIFYQIWFFYQHFINFLSTFYQVFFINFINFLTTSYQLFISFLSTLSTFYQLFINFISTFNCFSFMSYISALPNIIFALHSLCSIGQSTFASYVSGAPQLRSPPVAANMHLKMILKFVYPHCLMHPPQQPLKGHWISMCNLQSVIFHPSTSWSTSITVIV